MGCGASSKADAIPPAIGPSENKSDTSSGRPSDHVLAALASVSTAKADAPAPVSASAPAAAASMSLTGCTIKAAKADASPLDHALALFLAAPALHKLCEASTQVEEDEENQLSVKSNNQRLPSLPWAWTCQDCGAEVNAGSCCSSPECWRASDGSTLMDSLAKSIYDKIHAGDAVDVNATVSNWMKQRMALRLRKPVEVNSFVSLLPYDELESACAAASLPVGAGKFQELRQKVAGKSVKVLGVSGSGVDDSERIKVKVPSSGVVYIGLGSCKEWLLSEVSRDAAACALSKAMMQLPDIGDQAAQFQKKLEDSDVSSKELCRVVRAVELWSLAGLLDVSDHEEMVVAAIFVAKWYISKSLALVADESALNGLEALRLALFVASCLTGASREFDECACRYLTLRDMPNHFDCQAMASTMAGTDWKGPWSSTSWGKVEHFLVGSGNSCECNIDQVRSLLEKAPAGAAWCEPWRALSVILPASYPQHWHHKNSSGAFHEMICIPRRNKQGNESPAYTTTQAMLNATWMKIATRDRPCPKSSSPCAPQAGGCACVQDGADPGMPDGLRVIRLLRIEDSEMWSAYCERRDEIYQKRSGQQEDRITVNTDALVAGHGEVFQSLDFATTEAYLFHGTPVRAALSIARNDFSIDLAGSNTGTMYGAGCYLADCSSKADEYARDEAGGYYDGVYAMLLCRVAMGLPYIVEDRDQKAAERVSNGEFDSILGDRSASASTYREYVVYNAKQVYPEYCILYRRHGTNFPLHDTMASNLLVQIPTYWSNAHVDPMEDPFDEKYPVPEGMMRFLQWILYDNCGLELSVESAFRIEDSKMWLRYVEFRTELQGSAKFDPPNSPLLPVKAILHAAEQSEAVAADGDDLPSVSAIAAALRPNLDLSINECYLWHGTSHEVGDKVCENGFRFSGEITAGKRFGSGGYFAEDPAKSLEYAPVKDGLQALVFCRVICGKFHHTSGGADVQATGKAMESGCHATLACPSLTGAPEPREIVVYEESHVYPEYILYVKDSG